MPPPSGTKRTSKNRQGWKMPNACSRTLRAKWEKPDWTPPNLPCFGKAPFQSGNRLWRHACKPGFRMKRRKERPIPVQPRQHGAIHGPRQCKSPENLSNGHPALRIRPGREYPPQMVKRLTRHLHLNEDSRKFRRKRGSFLTPPLPGCPGRAASQNSLACLPHITGHKASTLPLTCASRASNSRFASSPPP